MKLFACVQPRVAVFGKKDYQQLMIIRRMVQQFALPIEIVGGETTRAPNGLALSSRNGYLTESERAVAVQLSQSLQQLAAIWQATAQGTTTAAFEESATNHLGALGWQSDYLTVRRRVDLQALQPGELHTHALIALGTACLGGTRLIDNLEF